MNYDESMVPAADQFRILRCQVSFYTPGMGQFKANRTLAWLLSQYMHVFDGDSATVPVPEAVPASIEIPRIILKSIDGKHRLHCGPAKFDLVLETDCISDAEFSSFLNQAAGIGSAYLKKFQLDAGRIACVVNRAFNDSNPAATLSTHFCKDEWIKGPLNRPEDFELHAHKTFRYRDLFTINSWMRCSCAFLNDDDGKVTPQRVILVRQDFNSLSEELNDRSFTDEELNVFLSGVPEEMLKVLDLYFPRRSQ